MTTMMNIARFASDATLFSTFDHASEIKFEPGGVLASRSLPPSYRSINTAYYKVLEDALDVLVPLQSKYLHPALLLI